MASFIFVVYLIWISWQDYKEMQVVRYSHLVGALAIVLQASLNGRKIAGDLGEYFLAFLVLLFLQLIACWLKIYGFADVIVFFLSGIFLLLEKGTKNHLLAYFLMQAISGGLLLVVQMVQGNVKGSKLKQPVPYIPYICVAFILTNMVL